MVMVDQWRIDNAWTFTDALRADYRKRNKHMRVVEEVLGHIQKRQGGERPPLDHCAFRSISGTGFGRVEAGQLFSALGYRLGGRIYIPNLHIDSDFWEPPAEGLPKKFFSEIRLHELRYDERTREDFPEIERIVMNSKTEVLNPSRIQAPIQALDCLESNQLVGGVAMDSVVHLFTNALPLWKPTSEDFKFFAQRPHLQEIASVLAYGLRINHFAFLLKDPECQHLGYISMESFARMLHNIGLPMKDVVEGSPGSMLRQTSTRAVMDICETWTNEGENRSSFMEWPGSYVEFVERGIDPNTGERFEGFLPNQAKQLFKMTERR